MYTKRNCLAESIRDLQDLRLLSLCPVTIKAILSEQTSQKEKRRPTRDRSGNLCECVRVSYSVWFL